MREAGRKPTTLAARYRSVQQFFKWAAEEGLVKRSPMATMRPPKIPESSPPEQPRRPPRPPPQRRGAGPARPPVYPKNALATS